ncbi:MAG: heavy-metal-associated domain-containing protein [Cytophagales bacterium]|nr:heavy-metal-associated domain-containing protein [Cytophaga sp.]
MNTFQFKTNIQCGGCVATVTPFLNSESAIKEWKVDITNPSKLLSVTTDLTKEQVTAIVAKAGYKAESI